MAQSAGGLHFTFGFQCCLLFLLIPWEAGATPFQELQKTGESPSDHLFPLTPGLIYSSSSDHNPPHTGQRPPDLPKSIETRKTKHQYNTTHPSKAIHKSIDNSKTLDNESSGIHHKAPPISEQNTSNQGKDPIIRNRRSLSSDSTSPLKGSSDEKHPTSAPKRTTCKITKSVRTSRAITVRPVDEIISTYDMKSITTPHTVTSPSHSSVNSEISKKPIVSSDNTTKAMMSSHKITRTPEKSDGAEEYNTTIASDKPLTKTTKHTKETLSSHKITQGNHEKITGAHGTPTEHGGEAIGAHGTGAHGTPTVHGGEATGAHVTPTVHGGEATGAHEKMTQVSVQSSEHLKKTTTSTIKKTTRFLEISTTLTTETIKSLIKSTENPETTATVTQTIRSPGKAPEDKSFTTISPFLRKTEVTHQEPVSSLIFTTSEVDLSSIMSEAPGNKSHSHQNNDGSQAGLHAGKAGENGSFPPWAIVIVVLVAVILLLLFLGLIFLVFSVTQTRRALTQNTENDDPEDNEGPNSYPVYLMEQQTLGMSQIPSPQ
ncbi:mucin-like protein 3 [Sciurus carolinensis]|uniref:mucin-like protein 3 n=1 Tax=Sciurus carolinensis TaxID=30640 RepID=UPI001FB2CBC8|nr:mucin-like protein 3 [Sciurus carolinensis]